LSDTPATRVLNAWVKLEGALRNALPVCSVSPPTQPTELLYALRINQRIGPEQEAWINILREVRNRVAHAPDEPPEEEVVRYEAEVALLTESLEGGRWEAC